MQRLPLGEMMGAANTAPPDATALDVADVLERSHASRVIVAAQGRPVGIVTEEDIVRRVLAPGLDPRRIRVRDIMHEVRPAPRGGFLLDDDSIVPAPLWGAEPLLARDEEWDGLAEILTGTCEECGVFSEELAEFEGLEMCPECGGRAGPRGA